MVVSLTEDRSVSLMSPVSVRTDHIWDTRRSDKPIYTQVDSTRTEILRESKPE